MANSYGSLSSLEVDNQTFSYYRLDALEQSRAADFASAFFTQGPAREPAAP